MNLEVSGVDTVNEIIEETEDEMTEGVEGWTIGTNIRYASFQEFGTSYQSGTPHVRPGFDKGISEFESIVQSSENAAQAITRLAFRIERYIKQFAPVDTGDLRDSYRAERI